MPILVPVNGGIKVLDYRAPIRVLLLNTLAKVLYPVFLKLDTFKYYLNHYEQSFWEMTHQRDIRDFQSIRQQQVAEFYKNRPEWKRD